MADFYVTVPSNAEKGDKLNDFRNFLPYSLSLSGQWEVALTEIIYPHTWNNVEEEYPGNFAIAIKTKSIHEEELTLTWCFGNVATNFYVDPTEFAGALDHASYELVKKNELVTTKCVSFFYDTILKRIYCKMTPDVNKIWFSEKLLYMMGFKLDKYEKFAINSGVTAGRMIRNEKFGYDVDNLHYAEFYPDMAAGFSALYIYCNIVEEQIIGNTMAPLLRVVNIEGSHYQSVDQVFHVPQYVKVLERDLSSIHILIKDDRGIPVGFESGKVILKLHFRKKT